MSRIKSAAGLAALLGVMGVVSGVSSSPLATDQKSATETRVISAHQGERNTGGQNGGTAKTPASNLGFGRIRKTNAPRGRGPGWTHAHARRVARKARSVKRHRSASRRKG